jgi:hypothetical protein
VPLTCQQLISLATQGAKVTGYTAQAAQLLNEILADECDTNDYAAARGVFFFNFNPTLINPLPGQQQLYGAGPYPLPLDYLRTSGSSGSNPQKSVFWVLNGVTYFAFPIDLQEFDEQTQQAGLQNFPYWWATDMSQRTIVASTVGNTHTNLLVDQIPNLYGVQIGMTVLGPGIPYLTTIVGMPSPSSITLSQPATASATSQPLTIGTPPVAYVYPPPNGAYPVTVRYQRLMPDLPLDVNGNLTPAAAVSVPWFPHQEFLRVKLQGELMRLTNDDRVQLFLGENSDSGAPAIRRRYLMMKDDSTNRAKRVSLDRRRFGRRWDVLPATKTIGF